MSNIDMYGRGGDMVETMESLATDSRGARSWRVILRLALVLLLTGVAPQAALAAPKDGQKFGDWAVKCNPPAKGADGQTKTFCYIFQAVVLKDKENKKRRQIMQIVIGYPAKGTDPVASVTVPLGVYLPVGFLFQVDQGKPYRVKFETCLQNGCQGRFALVAKLLVMLKKGLKGQVVFENRGRKKLLLPVSLVGFTKGLAALR